MALDPPTACVLLLRETLAMGGSTLFVERAAWLKRHGIGVVYASADGILRAHLEGNEIPFVEIPELGAQRLDTAVLAQWNSLVSRVVDIVDTFNVTTICAQPILPAMVAREVARVRNVGVHVEFLGVQTHLVPAPLLLDEITKGNASFTAGPSRNVLARRLGCNPDLFIPLELGIDLQRFATWDGPTIRDELGMSSDAVVVASVSRHDPDKSAHIFALIDAVAETQVSVDAPIHLVLVGDGSDHQRLRQYAEDVLLSDRAHFTGMLREVRPVYHGADIAVAIGSNAYEAAAAQRPVILASADLANLPDHREADPDRWAIGYFGEYDVHTCGDAEPWMRFTSIAERLRELVSDPGGIERWGETAYHRVMRDHDLDATMPPWAQHFERQAKTRTSLRLTALAPTPWRASALSPAEHEQVACAIVVPHDPAEVDCQWLDAAELGTSLVRWGYTSELVSHPSDLERTPAVCIVWNPDHPSQLALWNEIAALGIPIVGVSTSVLDRRRASLLSPLLAQIAQLETPQQDVAYQQLSGPGIAAGGVQLSADLLQVGRLGPDPRTTGLAIGMSELLVGDAADEAWFTELTGAELRTNFLPPVAPERRLAVAASPDASWLPEHLPSVVVVGNVAPAGNQHMVASALSEPITLLGAPDLWYSEKVIAHAHPGSVLIGQTDAVTIRAVLEHAEVVVDLSIAGAHPALQIAVEMGIPIVVGRHRAESWLPANAVRVGIFDRPALGPALERARASSRHPGTSSAPVGPTRDLVVARSLGRAIRTSKGQPPPQRTYDRSVALTIGNANDLEVAFAGLASLDLRADTELLLIDDSSDPHVAAMLRALQGDVTIIAASDLAQDGISFWAQGRELIQLSLDDPQWTVHLASC